MIRLLKKLIRSLYLYLLDVQDWLVRWQRKKLNFPPRRLRDVGGDDLNDFEKTGNEFVEYFKKMCSLSPDANVLEIGCGSGRIALPLAGYLSTKGSYVGIDVVAPSIEWCSKNISRKYPRFRFQHANLHNRRYNPSATVKACKYVFPVEDSSCDFIYLTSVFTHLLPADLLHYLHEIKRVIHPQGVIFATFFLLNKRQEELRRGNRNAINFHRQDKHHAIRDAQVPESAVAYDEHYLIDLLEGTGFSLDRPIAYGSWSGREEYLSYQDIVIFRPAK